MYRIYIYEGFIFWEAGGGKGKQKKFNLKHSFWFKKIYFKNNWKNKFSQF